MLAKTSFVNVSTADPMVCQPAAGDALLITNNLAGRVGKQEQLSGPAPGRHTPFL